MTENGEQDIPSQVLKTIFGLHASVIFRPKYVWFPAELIVYITSTRVDMYSQHILLNHQQRISVKFQSQ